MGEGAITIRGVTVTDMVDLDEFYAESQATRLNGVCEFTLRDDSLVDGSTSFAPREKDVVRVTDDGVGQFEGRIAHLTRDLVGRSMVYSIKVTTYEDMTDEAVLVTGLRTGSRTDRSDVIYLAGQVPGLSTDYTHVATIDASFDVEMRYGPGRVRAGLDDLASAVGAAWWVDDEKKIHWQKPKPVGSITAPWQVSTSPDDVTTFAPQQWSEPSDATGVINRMVVVGANDVAWTFDHDNSQTYFGGDVYEGIHVDEGITTEAHAERVANAYFRRYAYPARTGSYHTNQPGIKAGMVQGIEIEQYGIDKNEWVASVRIRFAGAERLDYEVTYGEPELTLARAIAAMSGGAGGGGIGGGYGPDDGTGGGGCGGCAGGCCTPYTGGGAGTPGPGQPINDELVGVGNGATTQFLTTFAYNPGSLRVWVDNVNVTSSMTETDPAAGVFDLDFAPTAGESVVVSYNAPAP